MRASSPGCSSALRVISSRPSAAWSNDLKRLTLESLQPVRVARERLGQDFQRHVAIELRVAGAKDLSHPACADRGGDFVDAEAGAGCKRQRSQIIGQDGTLDGMTNCSSRPTPCCVRKGRKWISVLSRVVRR